MSYKTIIKICIVLMLFQLLLNGCHLLRVPDKEVKEEKPVEDVDPEKVVETEKIYEIAELPDPGELIIKSTPSGIEYAVFEPGDGIQLKPDMQVSVHYAGYLGTDNTLFDSSYERDQPIVFTLGRNMVIRGWDQALKHLRVGDKARVWIPAEYAYGEQGRGPIPPNTDLIFDLEVIDGRELLKPELVSLAEKDTLETDSGLQIIMVRQGTGDTPPRGSILVVHYSGFLSDGTLFDSSIQRDTPFRFVFGTGQVLRGWDEGFLHLNKGAQARFIMPPHLAYGNRGAGPIPPNETLIFDVELIDIEY